MLLTYTISFLFVYFQKNLITQIAEIISKPKQLNLHKPSSINLIIQSTKLITNVSLIYKAYLANIIKEALLKTSLTYNNFSSPFQLFP